MPPCLLLPENAEFFFNLFPLRSELPSFEFLPEPLAPVFFFSALEFPAPIFEFLPEHLVRTFVFSVLEFPHLSFCLSTPHFSFLFDLWCHSLSDFLLVV